VPFLKSSLIAGVAAAALTSGSLYFIDHNRAREIARLSQANSHLRLQAMQQVRSKNLAAPEAPSLAKAIPGHPVMAPASPVADFRNEGRATPLAALQTFAWACDRGDSATVAGMLYFEGGGRAKVEAFMAALPATARGPWRSPEEMAAALLTSRNMNLPFPTARILQTAATEPVGEGKVVMLLPGTTKERTEFQKDVSGWKYVVTEEVVDAYIAKARSGPASPR